MKKKIVTIVIYLAGVGVSWSVGYDSVKFEKGKYNVPVTYGDIFFISVMSTTSWCSCVYYLVCDIVNNVYWETPINK